MSWREVLGVEHSTAIPDTHNPQRSPDSGHSAVRVDSAYQDPRETDSLTQFTQNTQNSPETSHSADRANCASKNPVEKNSKLLETLASVCRGLTLTPVEVRDALAPEDVKDWHQGRINTDTLKAFAHALEQGRERAQGTVPAHDTEPATCQRCGPVWLWFSGDVQGCPWCWNRVTGRPIPRPDSVRCGDCAHFKRSDHPHLGHCAQGEPEGVSGLWDTDRRHCLRYLPKVAATDSSLTDSETL